MDGETHMENPSIIYPDGILLFPNGIRHQSGAVESRSPLVNNLL